MPPFPDDLQRHATNARLQSESAEMVRNAEPKKKRGIGAILADPATQQFLFSMGHGLTSASRGQGFSSGLAQGTAAAQQMFPRRPDHTKLVMQFPEELRGAAAQVAAIDPRAAAEALLRSKMQGPNRDILKDPNGIPRYVATGEPVFPGIEKAALEGTELRTPDGLYYRSGGKPGVGGGTINSQGPWQGNEKYADSVAKGFGEMTVDDVKFYTDRARAASTQNEVLGQMAGLLDLGTETGFKEGAMLDVRAAAESFPQLKAIAGDRDQIPLQQAYRALANSMAAEMKQKLPGPMSDGDRAFLVEMVPGLAKTEEGNRVIIELYSQINNRRILEAKLAREYVLKNGNMSGFDEFARQQGNLNPLFSDDDKQRISTIVEGQAVDQRAFDERSLDEQVEAIRRKQGR